MNQLLIIFFVSFVSTKVVSSYKNYDGIIVQSLDSPSSKMTCSLKCIAETSSEETPEEFFNNATCSRQIQTTSSPRITAFTHPPSTTSPPEHLPSTPRHLPSTPGHLPSTPGHLPPTPGHLPSTPGHLPPTPGHLPSTPGHLPSTPGHLPSTPGHLPSTPGHLPSTPGHLPPTPGHLPSTPGHLPSTPGHLPSTPGHLPPTPGHLPSTPGHLPSTPGHLPSTPGHLPPTPGHLPSTPGHLPPTPGHLPSTPGHLPSTPGHLPSTPGHLPPTPGHLPSTPGHLPSTPGHLPSTPGHLPSTPGHLPPTPGHLPSPPEPTSTSPKTKTATPPLTTATSSTRITKTHTTATTPSTTSAQTTSSTSAVTTPEWTTTDPTQKPIPPQGSNDCRLVRKSVCLNGDPHYVTFDGSHFDYHGTCPHTFVEPCESINGYDYFSVAVKHHHLNKTLSQIQSAQVQLFNQRILMTFDNKLYVNGRRQTFPYYYPNATNFLFKIEKDGSGKKSIITKDSIGVTFHDFTFCVDIPDCPEFFGTNVLCGLAGDYNGMCYDDFKFKNGSNFEKESLGCRFGNSVSEWANSFITEDYFDPPTSSLQSCARGFNSNKTQSCHGAMIQCNEIFNAKMGTGPLEEQCRGLNDEIYIKNYLQCIEDVCYKKESPCSTFSKFVNECESLKNATLYGDWANSMGCMDFEAGGINIDLDQDFTFQR